MVGLTDKLGLILIRCLHHRHYHCSTTINYKYRAHIPQHAVHPFLSTFTFTFLPTLHTPPTPSLDTTLMTIMLSIIRQTDSLITRHHHHNRTAPCFTISATTMTAAPATTTIHPIAGPLNCSSHSHALYDSSFSSNTTRSQRKEQVAEMLRSKSQEQAALGGQQQRQEAAVAASSSASWAVRQPRQQAAPEQQQQQQQQQVRKLASDLYYGHELTAILANRFVSLLHTRSPAHIIYHFLRLSLARQIISMFNCPNVPPASSIPPHAPLPTLAHFIAYALHRTRRPHFVTLLSLLLLRRLKTRNPTTHGSSGHRLLISALMISCKVVCGDTYSNQSWRVVGQKMFSLKEVNQMEREMFNYLQWNLVSLAGGASAANGFLAPTWLSTPQNSTAQEVDEFEQMLVQEHGAIPGGRPIAPLGGQGS
jgi:hypothetical protein